MFLTGFKKPAWLAFAKLPAALHSDLPFVYENLVDYKAAVYDMGFEDESTSDTLLMLGNTPVHCRLAQVCPRPSDQTKFNAMLV